MLVCIGKDYVAYGIGIFGFRDEECLSQLMDHCSLTKSAETLKSRQPLPVSNVILISCEREREGGGGKGEGRWLTFSCSDVGSQCSTVP